MRPAPETRARRGRMIASQIANRGVRNRRVLAALAWTPREWFVPPPLAPDAYEDGPLPIGNGQTISQPYVVALMTAVLAPRRRDAVLEIGTGSGYQTAILARLAARVYTVERLPDLLVEAEARFQRLGLTNIETAAAPRIPPPLLEQLALGGRLVIPLGDLATQELVIVTRGPDGWTERRAGGVRFVPLVSSLAFTEPVEP